MSLDIKGEKCAVCQAYLFEEDDVVYCPECGAPHHRECYKSLGHCGLEAFHGTEQEYKRNAQKPQIDEMSNASDENSDFVTCGMCGEKYDKNESACPKCDTPNVLKFGGRFIAFDFLGGVPADTDLGEGVKADEAKKFVVSNTHRYIPKFLKFKNGKKLSWNWLAFISPCGWFLSRKMYGIGALIAALQIAFKIIMLPISEMMLPFIENYSFSSMTPEMATEIFTSIGWAPFAIVWGIALINFTIMLISALLGDYIYKNHVISTVSKIKAEADNVEEGFRKKGGINLLLGIIGFYLFSPFFL